MDKKTIGIFTGSLRKKSYNKYVAKIMQELLEEKATVQMMEIGNLPIFCQDYDDENKTPAEWATFRQAVGSLDAFLFVTPEYNRSLPPVLKNALDVASRPYGQNMWNGKPGGVISVSTGQIGGFGANHHLRQTLAFLNVYTMQQPEAYISNIGNSIDENGTLKNESLKSFLGQVADAFLAWIGRF